MINRNDLRIRDPSVIALNNKYYMCGTGEKTTLNIYRSENLEEWEKLGIIFRIPEDSWASEDTWAAEIHMYNSKYYLFVSLLGKNKLRGTQIAVCDTIDGIYIPVSNRPITPVDKSCIDATLYIQDSVPYIIYSHDWPDNYVEDKKCYVGEIWGMEVKPDLTEPAGEPFLLFASDEATLSSNNPNMTTYNGKNVPRYGSDGPFVQKLSSGSLFLTWSPVLIDNYVVLGAISESGNIRGPWRHLDKPLYDKNGGHAMFFSDHSGQKKMSIHAPNSYQKERACFFDVMESNGILALK